MGNGASATKLKRTFGKKGEPQQPAYTTPLPPPGPAPQVTTDGESSASQVVGSSLVRPKGPSPNDNVVVEAWRKEGKLTLLEGIACHVPYKITVVSREPSDFKEAANIVAAVFVEVQATFSHFVATSEVSRINALAVGQVHAPSDAMRKVLSMAAALHAATRGALDPAVLPLLESRGRGCQDNARLASQSKWSAWQVRDDGVQKLVAGAKMDLCSLAKGWAIDEVVDRLKAASFVGAYVDWGGDIKVLGQHPTGRDWNAMIVEPPPLDRIGKESQDSSYLAVVSLRDGLSIATSGDYRQTVGGLSHIVDARQGRPIVLSPSTLATASVVTQSCMVADGLATAAMSLGEDLQTARKMLDGLVSGRLKDPVEDFLLYAREGPRVARMCAYGAEKTELRDERLALHAPADVIVVGGGLAGISAALTAARARARVILVEKEETLGGNSAKATSGINAWGTRVQQGLGIDDDQRFFERDTNSSGAGGHCEAAAVQMLSSQSSSAIHWLMDELGVPLTVLSQLGGHSQKRTHRAPAREDGAPVPVGFLIMQHAQAVVSATAAVEIHTGCKMTGLLTSETGLKSEVLGITYIGKDGAEGEFRGDAVILTTGGFGYDKSPGGLMAKHRPDLLGIPTTNGPFAVGDAISLASEAVGATLVDMDKVQLHPTAFIDPKDPSSHTKYLGPEALRGSGGILLSQTGKRFCNELDLRSKVTAMITECCDTYDLPDGSKGRPWAWCVLDADAMQKFGHPQIRFYKDQVGLFEDAEDVDALARLIGCEVDIIKQTIQEYQTCATQGICTRTGKTVFPSVFRDSDLRFVAARITPCIHYCMGGLQISPSAEVQREIAVSKRVYGKREPVRRLFAAGEATGGVHGANRLGGNSLLECVVFGRIAGERAATIKQQSQCALSRDCWTPVTLREIRLTDEKYGQNTRVYRFNLNGALQNTGLLVGQFVAIRGELDGETLTGYYSPVTRPDDIGIISILCRTDEKGGPIVRLLSSLKPGSACHMKAMGGLSLQPTPKQCVWNFQGRDVSKLSLLAGGTGLAPMVQIARAFIGQLDLSQPLPADAGVRIVYAAENSLDLAFIAFFEQLRSRFPTLVSYYLVLNDPPPGWTQGIGFVDPPLMKERLWFPPTSDSLTVMCGPPIFEKIMCGNLSKLGFEPHLYYAFSNDPL